jgi:hypothetical protein
MEGISTEEATKWRETATDFFAVHSIGVKDPTRRKKFHDEVFSTNLANRIVQLDMNDIAVSSTLLVNLKERGAGKAWGSVMELALASQQGKPIITVIEEGFHHPFIEALSTEVYHSLDEALEATLAYYR